MLQETLRVELEPLFHALTGNATPDHRNREEELQETLRSLLQTELRLHEDRMRRLISRSWINTSEESSSSQTPRAPPAPPERLSMSDVEAPPISMVQPLPGLIEGFEDERSERRPSGVPPIPGSKGQSLRCSFESGCNGVVPTPLSADKRTSAPPTSTDAEDDEQQNAIDRFMAQEVVSAESESYLRALQFKLQKNVVEKKLFDGIIISCIILNSLSMGVQGDWGVSHLGQPPPSEFETVDSIFAVIFTSELFLRIFVYNLQFLKRPEWRWNIFDCLVVGVQMFDIITGAVLPPQTSSPGSTNISFIRLIRMLRLLRILRLVRLLRFVAELRAMVMSIASSMKSLVWTLVLLFFVIFIMGVYLCQTIADRGLEDPSISGEEGIRQYYGGLFATMESLYQAITGGNDWRNLVEPLATRVSPIMPVVFVLYISFAVLAMMNVVTGIFVESALQTTRQDEENEMRRTLKDIFNKLDATEDGVITYVEFTQHLDQPEVKSTFESMGFDVQEAARLFRLLDTDHSGSIESQELLEGCLRLRGPATAMDVAIIQYSSKRVFEFHRSQFEVLVAALDIIINKLPEDSEFGEARTGKLDRALEQRRSMDSSKVFGSWTDFRPRKSYMPTSG